MEIGERAIPAGREPERPRKMGLPFSGWGLVLSNLLPLAGVLFWGWDAFLLLLLFWAENVVVGGIQVFRILLAQGGGPRGRTSRFFLAPFFALHYGLFTFVHGVFIVVLCGPYSPFRGGGGDGLDPVSLPSLVWNQLTRGGVALSLLVLGGSHLLAFVTDYILGGEYKEADPARLMMRPYGRVVVLHLAILGGGFLAAMLGSPLWVLVLLVVFKTGLDLRGFLKERMGLAMTSFPAGGGDG